MNMKEIQKSLPPLLRLPKRRAITSPRLPSAPERFQCLKPIAARNTNSRMSAADGTGTHLTDGMGV